MVISEIMYHPVSGLADDEYVELHNRGTSAADLGGWHLRGEADFDIPAGTTVAGDGRLVLAKDPARLRAAYPGLNSADALGPFTGSLSDHGGRVALRQPVPYAPPGKPAQTLYAEVDALDHGTGGRWGRWSDGGGSSLELADPRADGRLAPAWGDSDGAAPERVEDH